MDTQWGRKLPKQDDFRAGPTKRDVFIGTQVEWHNLQKQLHTSGTGPNSAGDSWLAEKCVVGIQGNVIPGPEEATTSFVGSPAMHGASTVELYAVEP
jgi:hypothetical protein